MDLEAKSEKQHVSASKCIVSSCDGLLVASNLAHRVRYRGRRFQTGITTRFEIGDKKARRKAVASILVIFCVMRVS